MKKTKIVWRLKEQPTAEKLRDLVSSGILNKEEARQILFSSEEVTERDIESFKSEIKFLRELVEKLSKHNNQRVVEVIREVVEVETPIYIRQPWYPYYYYWCGTADTIGQWSTDLIAPSFTINSGQYQCSTGTNFSDIKSF